MRRDFRYQIILLFFGGYLGLEYIIFLVWFAKDRDEILPRLVLLGLTGFFAALLIAIVNSVDDGIPHDAFVALFGVSLALFQGWALGVKIKAPKP